MRQFIIREKNSLFSTVTVKKNLSYEQDKYPTHTYIHTQCIHIKRSFLHTEISNSYIICLERRSEDYYKINHTNPLIWTKALLERALRESMVRG
jgi:hypothetical protein